MDNYVYMICLDDTNCSFIKNGNSYKGSIVGSNFIINYKSRPPIRVSLKRFKPE